MHFTCLSGKFIYAERSICKKIADTLRLTRIGILFYCDPPYYGTKGYGVNFGSMDKLARTIKGKMIISVNDIPEMRQAFVGAHMESVDITYTGCGGKKGSQTADW
jgi:DNA adenine methylase